MDYEKKYKEALSRAATELETCGSDKNLRNMIYAIFPDELKESEDERIREEIKVILANTDFSQFALDYTFADMINWLEKQGKSSDHIHYWTEEEIEPIINDYLRGVEHYGGMIGRLRCLKPKQLEKQGESYTKKDVDDAYLKGISDAKHELEKQGEQKPILDFKASNWYVSKVDGKIHDMTYNPADKVEPFDKYEGLTDFERTLADICIGWIGEELGWKQYIKDNADVLLKIAIKKFNSIQDAPFEQKSAWSEEDEEMTDDVIKGCVSAEKAHHFIHTPKEVADWLKSLKDRIGG